MKGVSGVNGQSDPLHDFYRDDRVREKMEGRGNFADENRCSSMRPILPVRASQVVTYNRRTRCMI